MHVVVLAGGVGGSKFAAGAVASLADSAVSEAQVTVIGNTADDLTLHGLRICPDLDTMMYALGNGISADRGWGRDDESFTVLDELRTYGVEPTWFGLGDKDLATHLIRTELLNSGASLSEVTAALSSRWLPDQVRLLPMSDDRVESHVVIEDPASPSGVRTVHFQEYWVRLRAQPTARSVVQVGIERATAAPGVLQAISDCDVILVAPSNPVVSIGPILAVPGIRTAIRQTRAPVIGFSGIIDGHPVLGMADKLLPTINVECSAAAVGRHYGSRTSDDGILDAWVVHTTDAGSAESLTQHGLRSWADDLIMTNPQVTAGFITRALDRVFDQAQFLDLTGSDVMGSDVMGEDQR